MRLALATLRMDCAVPWQDDVATSDRELSPGVAVVGVGL